MKPTDEYQDHPLSEQPPNPYDLVQRLRKRAEIRRQITTRKSVQNNEPDRISELLEEAANEIESLREEVKKYEKHIAVRYLEEQKNERK
jgi:hypothetical protein